MRGLKDIKVGEYVVVRHYGAPTFYKVERLTATLAICTSDVRFKLDSGLRVGSRNSGRFSSIYGYVCTSADLLKSRIARAQSAISRVVVTEQNLAAVESLTHAKEST